MQLDPNERQRIDKLLVELHNATGATLVELRKNNIENLFSEFQSLLLTMNKLILTSGNGPETISSSSEL